MVETKEDNGFRLFLGFFVPIFAMFFINTIYGLVVGGSIKESFTAGSGFAVLSFFLAGLQLLAYTFVLEFLINPKIKNIYYVSFISGLLGVVVYLSAWSFFTSGLKELIGIFINELYHLSIASFIIGLVLGYILKFDYDQYD